MSIESVYFKGYRCFKDTWSGFDTIKSINLIIGRNNSGKSHLLDLIESITTGELREKSWKLKYKGTLEKKNLANVFRVDTSGGDLGGNHWNDHGEKYVNNKVEWCTMTGRSIDYDSIVVENENRSSINTVNTERRKKIGILLSNLTYEKLQGKQYCRLYADRDLLPEDEKSNMILQPDGTGATNIVRRFLNSTSPDINAEIVEVELLDSLNKIFIPDGDFRRISVKQHDYDDAGDNRDKWEILLGEDNKGLIPLSNSGSGLRTILLVLIYLLIYPYVLGKERSEFVFAFEELENNLHPSLLRRLLQFIEDYSVINETVVFLTTHSNVALDLFSLSDNAQIVHVAHDGKSASTRTISKHFDKLSVINDLGARPSDLLQANGIVWVEGPSDRIYLNRWIELYSDNKFREGRDYQCAFYGGSLLARINATDPDEEDITEFVNLININPNIVVVCDGDRSSKGTHIKGRVRRIRDEVRKIPNAHTWITQGREIENYLTGTILQTVMNRSSVPDPDRYIHFFSRKGQPDDSFSEKRLNRKSYDKVKLALETTKLMTKEQMINRFDWEDNMKKIVQKIDGWNK